MTAYAILNDSFRAVSFYVCRESKDALILAAEGVRTNDAQHMAEDFTFQRQLQPDLGMAVLHIPLSLSRDDAEGRSPEQVSQLLERAARMFIKELEKEEKVGPIQTQWALVQHFDKPHPHAHLVLNRVNNKGNVIPDEFIGQYCRKACQRVEQELGLFTAEEQGRAQASRGVDVPTNRQAVAVTPREKRVADWHRARHTVAKVLLSLEGKTNGFADLADKLAPHNIKQVVSEHRHADGTIRYGVRFELDGHRFKGGEVGKDFTAPKLMQKFAQHQAEAPARQATASAMDEFRGLPEVGKLSVPLAESESAVRQRDISLDLPPPEAQGSGQLPVSVPESSLPPAMASLVVDLKEASEPSAGRSPVGHVIPADPPVNIPFIEAVPQQSRLATDTFEEVRQAEQLRKAAEQQATADALAGVEREQALIAAMVQQADQAERAGDYARVAELRYGAIQEAEKRMDAHKEEASATPEGKISVDEILAREQKRLRVATEAEDAEQRRLAAQRLVDLAREAADAARTNEQRRADNAMAAWQQAQQQVSEYRTQLEAARERWDYGLVGPLRDQKLPNAEREVQRCEAVLRATPGTEAYVVQVDAYKKDQMEQAQAAHERQELAELEKFRGRQPYSGTHIRLQVPVEYLPKVRAAVGQSNSLYHDWVEHADKTRAPRVDNGKVAVNILYKTTENDVKLDDALQEFRRNGVEVFEQPAERTKREERAANARTFERQYAEKMRRSNALPGKEMDRPSQREM